MNAPTSATLALLRDQLAKAGSAGDLAKTFTQPSVATQGLQTYNLEGPAKNLYPVLSPIRNSMPRVKATGGIQANWKAVTGVNTTNLGVGVAEGLRGGNLAVTTEEFYAAFRTLGIEASVTEEADLSAEGYDDLRARAANSGLQALMMAEERVILYGNSSTGLGITPTPVLTTATTGGSIAASTNVSVICVALTAEGMTNASMGSGVPATITRNNMGGTQTVYNAGAAQRSAATVLGTGSGTATNTITATVSPVQGASGYAWFAGVSGSEYLVAITSYSQVVIKALGATTFTSAALNTDHSKNSTIFDGLIALNMNPSSNAYWYGATPGQGLTPDGYGGIVEFDNVLKWYYDNLRAAPSAIWVSSQEMQTIKQKFLGGPSNTTATRFVFNVQPGQLMGGGVPKGYMNMFGAAGSGNAEIPLMLHPYLPQGTVIFELDKLPYPMNNVGNVRQILTRRDYHQREWPQTQRQYEYGVYSDEVLQHYFPVSIAVISNLAPF